MLIGHFAVGLALKARFKSVPLLPLLISVQLLDWIWIALASLGEERFRLVSAGGVLRFDFEYAPYSHSLFWAAFYAIVTFLLFSRAAGQTHWAAPLSLGVFSHWLLDWMMHHADLPFANFGPAVTFGWGLQASFPVSTVMTELALLVLGWWMYYRAVRRDDGRKNIEAWGILAVLAMACLSVVVFNFVT